MKYKRKKNRHKKNRRKPIRLNFGTCQRLGTNSSTEKGKVVETRGSAVVSARLRVPDTKIKEDISDMHDASSTELTPESAKNRILRAVQKPWGVFSQNRQEISNIPITPMDEKMISLFHRLSASVSKGNGKIIQFIGSTKGEGTTTLVREFARVSSTRLGKSVFLIDTDCGDQNSGHYNGKPTLGLDSLVNKHDIPIPWNFFWRRSLEYICCPVTDRGTSASIVFRSPYAQTFFRKLKEQVDLILIDSPPATASEQGIEIVGVTDGVVLVIEAESTRWPIVNRVKDRIIESGGNIVGTILNKKRYHIPEYIYQRL